MRVAHVPYVRPLLAPWRALLLGLLAGMALASPATAQSGTKLIVLGIRSVEGDDAFAKELTDALRESASQHSSWSVEQRPVSMSQMALAHGCDEVDALCLSDIAKGLDVQAIIYGTTTRTSARRDYDFRLTLSLYDATTGSIMHSISETIPQGEAHRDGLLARTPSMIEQLATGGSRAGRIIVRTNVRSAEVVLDGQPVGMTRDRTLNLEGVTPGVYQIEILAQGHLPYKEELTVEAGRQASVLAMLEPEATEEPKPTAVTRADLEWDEASESDGSLAWLGYSLIGVGVASLGGMVASWLVIKSIDEDTLLADYRNRIARTNPNNVSDVCVEALNGESYGLEDRVFEIADLCERASLFESLQWVFLGGAVVSGTIGTFILISDADQPDPSERAGWSVQPRVGPGYQGLSAELRF